MFAFRQAAPAALVTAALVAGCADGSRTGAAVLAFADPAVLAATAPTTIRPPAASTAGKAGSYVVEFRARAGPDIIGHSYLVFGKLAADAEITDPVYTGLYPDDITGFAVAVGGAPATTDAVALDHEIAPTVVYRRALTPDEYERLSKTVEYARAHPPRWSWANYNCNTYLADLARDIGLETPTGGTWLAPTLFVSQLRQLNG